MTLILMIANAAGLFIPTLPPPISRELVALKKIQKKNDNANRFWMGKSLARVLPQEQVEMLSFEHCKTFSSEIPSSWCFPPTEVVLPQHPHPSLPCWRSRALRDLDGFGEFWGTASEYIHVYIIYIHVLETRQMYKYAYICAHEYRHIQCCKTYMGLVQNCHRQIAPWQQEMLPNLTFMNPNPSLVCCFFFLLKEAISVDTSPTLTICWRCFSLIHVGIGFPPS